MDFVLKYLLPCAVIYLGVLLYILFRRREYLSPALLFLFFVIVYSLTNYKEVSRQSFYCHFVHYASALLKGHWYLDFQPGYHDLSRFGTKYFIGFGPLPAVLMMPFVLIYGSSFNDVFFTVILGASNCVLVYAIIRKLGAFLPERKWDNRLPLFMSLFFGLSTVNWYLAAAGEVWHTAQIVTTFFMLLAVREALGKRRPWLVGLWAALPILSRPSVFCAFPFFCLLLLRDYLKERDIKKFCVNSGLYLLPYLCAGIFCGLFNLLRFGNPLDFGFAYMNHSPNLLLNLNSYGKLNAHYFPINAKIFFLGFFQIIPDYPYLILPSLGLSFFLTSPLALYAFKSTPLSSWKLLFHNQPASFLKKEAPALGGWLGVICILLPLLFFFNTGWMQFGYRYSLDFLPLLIVPVAMGLGKRITIPAWILLGLGTLVTGYGSLVFHNFPALMK